MRHLTVTDLPAELRGRWSAARVLAVTRAPYLATAVLALQLLVPADPGVPADELSRFPTDEAWHVYADPGLLRTTPTPELAYWLLHHVTHLLHGHAARSPLSLGGEEVRGGPSGDRVRWEWNAACDAEIDDDLASYGLLRPAGLTGPDALGLPAGLLAERYWHAVQAADSRPLPAGAGCGSCCDGQRRPWQTDLAGVGRLRAELLARDVGSQIRSGAAGIGDVPAGWRRWAADRWRPQVDWRKRLSGLVRRTVGGIAGKVDFTYNRPSRRSASVPDVVIPSLHQPSPRVAVLLDTSASCDEDLLGQALAELRAILRSVGVRREKTTVLCFDSVPYTPQRVRDVGEVHLLGGGGTDAGAGLAAAAALRPRPDVVVVLTDGETSWPAQPPPGCRVVVGLLGSFAAAPEWAETVLIERVAGDRV
ncbi:MAG: hypothetical protein V7637_6459 [Mycobacteriales bacterium]|jgi:predicted metal-dependent peptidase